MDKEYRIMLIIAACCIVLVVAKVVFHPPGILDEPLEPLVMTFENFDEYLVSNILAAVVVVCLYSMACSIRFVNRIMKNARKNREWTLPFQNMPQLRTVVLWKRMPYLPKTTGKRNSIPSNTKNKGDEIWIKSTSTKRRKNERNPHFTRRGRYETDNPVKRESNNKI